MATELDSFNAALIEAVKALGGSKAVGVILWPERAPDSAQRQMLDCLNPERPAHLTPDQVALVLRLAHQAGAHHAMNWLMDACGYAQPVPLTPVDEAAELQRKFIAATEQLAGLMRQLERTQAPAPLGGAYMPAAGLRRAA